MTLGIVIGRFQVPDLHPSHHILISQAARNSEQLAIFIAIPKARGTNYDPLDFLTRKLMLQEYYPDAILLPLPDNRSDEAWSTQLDKKISELQHEDQPVTIFTGPNGLASSYKGNYNIETVEEVPEYEGASLHPLKQTPRNSAEFRRGVIYGVSNKYPITHMTTDIAVMRDEKVLLAKRPGREYYRFPGGFMHFSDGTLEDCAARELFEETGIIIDSQDFTYVGSHHVKDWRYINRDDARIMTTLFATQIDPKEHTINLNEEFQEYDYLELTAANLDKIEVEHRPLFQMLIKHHRGKQ